MGYFKRLVKRLNVESNGGERCDKCPVLRDCVKWWDTKVCSFVVPMSKLSLEGFVEEFNNLIRR